MEFLNIQLVIFFVDGVFTPYFHFSCNYSVSPIVSITQCRLTSLSKPIMRISISILSLPVLELKKKASLTSLIVGWLVSIVCRTGVDIFSLILYLNVCALSTIQVFIEVLLLPLDHLTFVRQDAPIRHISSCIFNIFFRNFRCT